jgi:hypothetical protein
LVLVSIASSPHFCSAAKVQAIVNANAVMAARLPAIRIILLRGFPMSACRHFGRNRPSLLSLTGSLKQPQSGPRPAKSIGRDYAAAHNNKSLHSKSIGTEALVG